MRKIIIAVVAGGLSFVGVGAALAQGPDPSGPAKYGLCTAYAHNNQHAKDNGQAFKNLESAASSASESVEQFCSGATPGGR